jgi:hypothetical protein
MASTETSWRWAGAVLDLAHVRTRRSRVGTHLGGLFGR